MYGRLGEFTSFDAGLNGAFNSRRVSTNFFINTNGATGRVADPGENNDDPTTQNYSASITNKIELASFADLNVTGRMFYEGNNSTFEFSETIDDRSLTDNVGNENTQRDLSFNSILALRPSGKSRVNLDYYFSQFRTENLYDTEIPEFRDILLEDTFNQYYQKLETNSNYYWNNNHITSAGVGSTFERLRADRYPDNPSFNTQFVFAQHEWQIFPALAFTGGMRWDNHSEFESRFTPKGSLLLKVNDELRLRASVGTGFRSPDFRQLFLDFSNPVAGYSVFGSSNVDIGVQRLDELGLIRRIISDPTGLDPLVPEASVAFNGGFDYFINEFSTIRFNLFRNNVNNLIETLPIAERTSRQFVFTYFNLENVVTQGFDVDIRTRLSDQVQLSLGYQYLDATQEVEFDRTILDSNGAPVTVTQTSNLTLPNRSTHSGNMKFVFNESLTGIQANYRVVFNGVFNVGDVNGNNRIDSSEELPDQELRFLGLSSLTITDSVPGYLIHDVTLGKQFGNYLVQAGIDNMFNFQNFRFVPGQLGRVMYLRFSTKIF
ncbi:MAG: TonB-dependent receptor [Bacteroidota bacterium]